MRSTIALFVAAAIAGCGDSSTAPVPHTLDVSAEIAAMTMGSVDGIPGVSSLLSLPASTTLPTVTPSACAYYSTTQGFTCPTIGADGLTFDISYFLADVAGQSQSAPSVDSTASIRAVTNARGTVTLPTTAGTSGSVTLTNHMDLTMSGLLSDFRSLDGSSTAHYDLTTTGTEPAHSLIDVTTTVVAVTLPPEGSPPAWPGSGTVTTLATAVTSIGYLPSVTTLAQAVITFDGTSTPTATVTVNGAARTCRIDLTGLAEPDCD